VGNKWLLLLALCLQPACRMVDCSAMMRLQLWCLVWILTSTRRGECALSVCCCLLSICSPCARVLTFLQ
jgi:hypothetical protein